MKKKLSAVFALLTLGFLLNQTKAQNHLWSLPPISYDVLFNNSQPLPTNSWGYNGAPAQFAHNAMHDAQGNLLFFVVDGRYCSVI
jgi:hypothetical protein